MLGLKHFAENWFSLPMSRDKKGETIGNWADCLLNPVKHALEVADLKKKKKVWPLGF